MSAVAACRDSHADQGVPWCHCKAACTHQSKLTILSFACETTVPLLPTEGNHKHVTNSPETYVHQLYSFFELSQHGCLPFLAQPAAGAQGCAKETTLTTHVTSVNLSSLCAIPSLALAYPHDQTLLVVTSAQKALRWVVSHVLTTAACAAVYDCVSADGKCGSIICYVCQWCLHIAKSGRRLTQQCTGTLIAIAYCKPPAEYAYIFVVACTQFVFFACLTHADPLLPPVLLSSPK